MVRERVRAVTQRFLNVRKGRARYTQIHERVREGAEIDGMHICQLIAAMIIASIGLNLDSTEAVIGAMLICPLMGTVVAIAYSVATANLSFLREAISKLIFQFMVCLITSTLYFLVSPLGITTSELTTNSTATLWDAVIAITGGFAGALGTSRKSEPSVLLAGVAVATSLMPPLCATGFGISSGDFRLALAAAYEFIINVAFIAIGAEIVFLILRIPPMREKDGKVVLTLDDMEAAEKSSGLLRTVLVIASLVIAVPSLAISARHIERSQSAQSGTVEKKDAYETQMTSEELKILNPNVTSYRVGVENEYNSETSHVEQRTVAIVGSKSNLSDSDRQSAEQLIRLHVENVDRVEFVLDEKSGT